MDKCREDLEAKFANSPELKEGHIFWWDVSQSYVAKTEDFQESADYWNQILNAWRLRQPDIDLLEAKVEELQKQLSEYIFVAETIDEMYVKEVQKSDELQKRVDELERKLQIKTRHCEFYEQSRNGHRSLAIHRKKQINSALEQIEKLYSKAENDYEKDRNPYYDGMLSALDLAEQAIRGELEEQALKGDQYDEHRKKAEEAISKGASLTSHRIEL
ncbi:hypothetical protein EHF38_06825 [Acinetobacter baumannii]|uniref:hypothetical protein n=1 Tax=Acinetobacter baumannii TaxID=470 RepID=UPI000FEC3E0C|nr:hypothetical protein [Acinetobacter baumannii]QAB40061.1 hypothetical protein EHF38_06825 [Acinetobacter baumannii]